MSIARQANLPSPPLLLLCCLVLYRLSSIRRDNSSGSPLDSSASVADFGRVLRFVHRLLPRTCGLLETRTKTMGEDWAGWGLGNGR